MGKSGLFVCFGLLLWLPLTPHVRANIVEPPFVDFGIKGMCSLSNMHANDGASFKNKVGVENADSDITSFIGTWGRPGLYAEFVLTDFFGVQTGAYYLSQYCHLAPKRKGAIDQGTSSIRLVKFRSHGLSIPLALCFYPTGREVDESFITLLVGLDFLLTFKNDFDDVTDRKITDDERVGLFNFAGLFGLSFQFPIGLFVEFMFDFWVLNTLSHTHSIMNKSAKLKMRDYTMFSDLDALKALNAKDVSIGIGYNFGALLYR